MSNFLSSVSPEVVAIALVYLALFLLTGLTVAFSYALPWLVKRLPVKALARLIAFLFSGMYRGTVSFVLDFLPWLLIAGLLLAIVIFGGYVAFVLYGHDFLMLLVQLHTALVTVWSVMFACSILAFLLCSGQYVNALIDEKR